MSSPGRRPSRPPNLTTLSFSKVYITARSYLNTAFSVFKSTSELFNVPYRRCNLTSTTVTMEISVSCYDYNCMLRDRQHEGENYCTLRSTMYIYTISLIHCVF